MSLKENHSGKQTQLEFCLPESKGSKLNSNFASLTKKETFSSKALSILFEYTYNTLSIAESSSSEKSR